MEKINYDGPLKYTSFVKMASNIILMGKFNLGCPNYDENNKYDITLRYIYHLSK
jgi:hypothetical protein